MLSHGDTPICQNLVCLYQRAKTSCQTQMPQYNFDIEVKGQGHTEFMNVRNTSYHGDTLMCQAKNDYVKGQKS